MSTSVGGPPVNHSHNDSANGGRNQTIPAVPSPVVNGNNSFSSDHTRKPSMMVTAAGATGQYANGGTQGKPNNIQFGSMNAAGSPAMGTPPPLAHQPSASLGVNNLNPRGTSPQNSPSPIPQPVSVSGGKPPSTFQGQGNGLSFGQLPAEGNENAGMRPGLAPHFTPQNIPEHMRRGSSQSMHGDMGTQSLPTGPGRGNYTPNRGRGGYSGGFQGQVGGYQPNNFRPNQNNRGMQSGYQNQGRHPFPNSPNLGSRTPIMHNASPGTPQMAQMNMMPGMPGQPAYSMGPFQQGYGVPTAADPSIQYMYNSNFYQQPQMQGQYYQAAPPQSPRPPFQQPGYAPHMQPTFSNQGQVPPSMSRQSSAMSATAATTDRPSSSVGQTPHTPSISGSATGARTPSVSAQKSEFTLPTKKSAAIQIKNSAGEIVTFNKGASSSNATPATSTPVIATPPSRTGSAADHTRSDSVAKTDDEKKKAMQEAVAKKVAEEQARAKQAKDAADQKAQMDKEAAEAAERDAAKAREEAEALEKEAKEAEAAEAAKAAKAAEEEKAAAEAAAAAPAKNPADDEPDFDAIEAELAAIEAEEARQEEEYQKKKAASREAQRKKEEEEAAAYEANMKEMERKAEEEELLREKKLKEGGGSEDEAAKKMFAALKAGGEAATPTSTADDSPTQTPAESGAVTPVSDTSMPPPKGTSRRNKVAELTLDTKKSVEPPEPSATLKSLTTARRLEDPTTVDYPAGFASPNPALNKNAPADRRFKYDKEFLLQFQSVFKEKPSLDWDTKIREALGDGDATSARTGTARTPSGMGGRSASNRNSAASGFTPMGNFGGRPGLPPGTTSEQRFAASNALRGGPMTNPFAFGRPGSMGPPMGRTPSNNPLGGIPGSPRVGGASRGGSRAESKRGKQSGKQTAEENKSMPLTAGMAFTALETSSTGWKPRSIGQQATAGPAPGGEGYLEPDVVQRKVKAALNKMTPEKFEKIADQILDIAAQSKNETDGRTLRQVIQLTFEKATDEAHWAPMYAMFCRKMLQSMSPDIKDENIKDKNGDVVTGGNLFRKYLLNRCQEEFERGWKVNLPRQEGQSEEAAMLSEEYYIAAAAKRRGLGLVKFIGELFKLGMLTERIMHECVKKLVDYEGTPDESEVESLTSLLRTIGKQLDSPESRAQGRMDVYFERITQTMNIPDLPSRLRFMLMDIVDLRKKGWNSAADDKGPKTIAEIHEEAERAAQKAEMARLASQAGGRGGGRMPMGRGDARSFSGYGQVPPPDNSNRVGADDLRRLGGNRSARNVSNTAGPSLGPPSMLGGRTNSGRRGLGPGGLLSRGEDSAASSRTGTPPAQKDKDKKDESSTNAFSALAALDGHEGPSSNPSSPPTQKSQPNIARERSRSPEKATG